MNDLVLAEEVLAKIRGLGDRFHPRAYIFVLEALEFAQCRLPARRHVSGAELAWACRDYARERYGLLARTVLRHWGVRATDDLGRLVFTLVDVGLLAKRPDDRVEDFEAVYDFAEAFDGGYRWPGVGRSA